MIKGAKRWRKKGRRKRMFVRDASRDRLMEYPCKTWAGREGGIKSPEHERISKF